MRSLPQFTRFLSSTVTPFKSRNDEQLSHISATHAHYGASITI